MSEDVKRTVRERYGELARRAMGSGATCCGPEAACDGASCSCGYSPGEVAGLPAGLAGQSLGCGNPVALADLKPGEVVLDLGSGAGLDVLLSARRVGDRGKAYGLDMTDEMLALARKHQRESGITNVEFLQGEMEDIPLPDGAVDVIISNCVVNLSPDKEAVVAECHRVLRPGGRVAVFDLVWDGEVPEGIRDHPGLWSACIGGALSRDQYRELLERAGFEHVEIEVAGEWSDPALSDAVAGEDCTLVSAFVRARKRAGTG